MKRQLEVFLNENPIALMEKITFHLMEMGIQVQVVEADEDCVVYTLEHAKEITDA